ncbi:DUF1515 domain-containing protein [Rhizobiaceae bacterium n13]|uniref:DUF1515 family protein n=1 Tax=Ferirhizobium litorale TaxID=2927786 RepID=UPI0024B2A52A|nr:DUF1515 family protein [Fererhizobium litorale]MDI7864278.1 DUF1515 domain-containing protein [Fererhizobium litorale]
MSTTEVNAAVHQQLGSLEAKVDRILADQDQARADRKQQYRKAEEADRRFDELVRNFGDLDRRLKKMEPDVAEIGRWKERFIGMRLLIVVVAATFGATLATFGKWIAVKVGLG